MRSQLSNTVSRNVIRLLDQKLHCFKNKLYFSNFLNFTIVKKIVKIYWKKLKIQILKKSDIYIAQHRSTHHLKALILQFNSTKCLLTISQHLLTKNVLLPEQAYFGLQFGHVCFWRSLVSQQVKPIISKGHSTGPFCFFSVFCDSWSRYRSDDYVIYISFFISRTLRNFC